MTSVTWVITTAVVLLALLAVGGAIFGRVDGMPGPPVPELVAHVGGGVGAVILARVVARGTVGLPMRVLATLADVAILLALLWFYWWA